MYILCMYNKANIVMFDIFILEIVNKFMIIIIRPSRTDILPVLQDMFRLLHKSIYSGT